MFKDFGIYLVAFLDKWLFWVGIAMLILDLLGRHWPTFKAKAEKLLPRWTFGVMALGLLVLASFQVWHDEYREVHPGLHLRLDEYGFAQGALGLPTNQPLFRNGTPAIIVASISNLGPPSIADHWKLDVSVLGKKGPIQTRLVDFDLPNHPPLTIEGNNIPFDRLLYRETLTPISQGDKKQGVLIFFVAGMAKSDLAVKGTTLRLTCQDVEGDTIRSQTAVLTGTNQGFIHYPGLE